MTVFSCEPTWEAMLTCIFEAGRSRLGFKNIRLCLEPIEQMTLFDDYHHVDVDESKAEKVMDSINQRISSAFYYELFYCSMYYDENILDNIYRVMLLGFKFGEKALDMVQYECVMYLKRVHKSLGNEINHFQEFSRFHSIPGEIYVSHIEPKSRLLINLGPIFSDRMPSEHWIIVDDVHKQALIHPKNSQFYIRILNDEEFAEILKTEDVNDEYTDYWKAFFEAIAIKQRENPRCQRNLMPLWTRKHSVEFL